jgi:hypothetical protein
MTMLNSPERLDGMLFHLAKVFPNNYIRVGQKQKLSMNTVALNTAETVALARVGRLNDSRMKKIKSFLRQVGKVNLQLPDKEQLSLDHTCMNGLEQKETRRRLRNWYTTGTVTWQMK